MRIEFSEFIPQSVEAVFPYFETPASWGRLYGIAGRIEDRGRGWYAVPLHRFPFPLVASVTAVEPLRYVSWKFRGFWAGGGEVRFSAKPGGIQVEGFEDIRARWLPGLSAIFERLFMEREFHRIWALGWRRLRSHAGTQTAPGATPDNEP
jgi:hypothetical protein